jgi:hypothetical protein
VSINGSDILLLANTGTVDAPDYQVVASQRDVDFNDVTEEIDVSSKLSRAGRVLAGRYSANISLDGLHIWDDEGRRALLNAIREGELILLARQEPTRTLIYDALITRFENTFPDQADSTIEVDAVIDGFWKVVDRAMVATSKGLYKTTEFFFDDSDPTWERLGQELNIRAAFYDHSNPGALQLGIVGEQLDSEVWLRRPEVSDDWVRILTAQEALTVVGRASKDKEVLLWAAHHDGTIYATFIADAGVTKYLLRTSNYGSTWFAYDLSATYTVGRVDVHEATGMLYISICDGLGAKGQIIKSPDGMSRVEEFVGDGGGWGPEFFIEQATGAIIAGLEDNTATNPRLVASDNDYEPPIDDGITRAGVISPQQTGFTPQGALWRNGDTIRILRRDELYIGEYGGVFTSQTLAELEPGELGTARALVGIAGPKLIIGRNANTEETPDVVFATDDDGETIWGKGGAHADQPDGGGDSIPYTASVAWNGICIF